MVMEGLTEDEGRCAVRLARCALEMHIEGKNCILPEEIPAIFNEKRGVFVTLTIHGSLRGCIGFPYPVMPLGDAIQKAAVSAAVEDPRFPPVSRDELEELHLEVTVLTLPVQLGCLPEDRPSAVEVGRHGLIVSGFGTGGLLLPQVATEWSWDARTFLEHTCQKAGLPRECWMRPDIDVMTFEGQIFSE